jgi:hypothetical protein
MFPGTVANAPSVSLGAAPPLSLRPTWRRLPSPPAVIWRIALENRLPNQVGSEAVEVHLVPVGDDARLQVRDLTELAATLPGYGRQHGIFSPVEAIDVRPDGSHVTASQHCPGYGRRARGDPLRAALHLGRATP